MALSEEQRAEVVAIVRDELARADAGDRPAATTSAAGGSTGRVRPAPATPGPPATPPGRLSAWLGFPVHALLSAVPIGALACATTFDVAAHLAPEPYTYPRSSYWLLVIALVSSAVAVATGLVDHWRLDADGPEAEAGRRHQVVVYAGLALSVVSFVLRRQTDFLDEVPLGIVALSAASLLLVLVGSALGARMAYALGVGRVTAGADVDTLELHADARAAAHREASEGSEAPRPTPGADDDANPS